MIKNNSRFLPLVLLGSLTLILSACGGSSDEEGDNSLAIDGRTPIAYVKRNVRAIGNPTDAFNFRAGGDLYMRQFASASSTEVDITGHLTNGQGDVSDPEVSYDGKRILFAMRLNTGSWKISVGSCRIRKYSSFRC